MINELYTYVVTAYNSNDISASNPYTIVTETAPTISSLGYIIDGSLIHLSIDGGFSGLDIAINNLLIRNI